MNKIYTLFLMMFLLVGTLSFVMADDASGDLNIPDAKKIGPFENVFGRLGLAFTFNKEKKIEKTLMMAERRFAEAEATIEDDPERAAKAQERYDELVARAGEILEEIEAESDNEEQSAESIGKMARVQNKFERHREHVDAIYLRAQERLEQNNASDEKVARFEMFHERALNKTNRIEARATERVQDAVKKHKVLTEMSDEELETVLEEIEEREGLSAERKNRMQRDDERDQKFAEVQEKHMERVQAHLNDSDLSE